MSANTESEWTSNSSNSVFSIVSTSSTPQWVPSTKIGTLSTDNAVLAQHVGIAKLGIVRGCPRHDRRPGLQRAPRRGVPISAKADMANHAGVPADAGLDQQIAAIGSVAQELDVTDMRDASHLRGGIL